MHDIASSYYLPRTIPHAHYQAAGFVKRLKMSNDLSIGETDPDGRPEAGSPR
jgi:hypothetical protein